MHNLTHQVLSELNRLSEDNEYEVDCRKIPDNRRRGQFKAGWGNQLKGRTYTGVKNQLTWNNLGFRMAEKFGEQSVNKEDVFKILEENFMKNANIYKANEDIILSKEIIDEIDGESVKIPVRVILKLWPYPILILESDKPQVIKDDIEKTYLISLKGSQKFNARIQSLDPLSGWNSLIILGKTIEFTTINKIQSQTLQSIKFATINFPKSLFRHDFTLENKDWVIRICEVQNFDDNLKILENSGGYAITHTGYITQKDNKSFSIEIAQKILLLLHWFLSFLYGRSCVLILINGRDKSGQEVWNQWGLKHYTHIWDKYHARSASRYRYKFLSEIFPQFYNLFMKNIEWEKSLIRTIDWYLNSQTSAMHTGIILNQASLERITFQIIGERKENEKSGEYIARLLNKLNINESIPSCFPKLEKFQKANKFVHGPHTLINIRNSYVHPKYKLKEYHADVQMEAWSLGLRYIEQILFEIMRFDLSYKMDNQTSCLLDNKINYGYD